MFSFGKPSKKSFGNQLMKAMHERTGGQYRFELESFEILRLDHDGRTNLATIYAEHCTLPRSERAGHIERLAESLGSSGDDLPEDYEVARANLRPKIWSRATIDNLDLKHRYSSKDPVDMPRCPVGEHLYLTLVYDTEHAMRSLNQESFDKWGVSFYQAMEDARSNLATATMGYSKIGEGVMCSITNDNYDSSRIVLLDTIRKQNFTGAPVALVPDRDSMYIADSADPQSIDIIFQLANKSAEESLRPLSPLPLVLQDDEWIDWLPPADHPVRPTFDRNRLHFLGGLYNDQQELLNELNSTNSQAPFVGSFSALQKKDSDTVFSYCVWSKDIESLLPRTDLVMFFDGGDAVASCRWDDVLGTCGQMLTVDDSFYPCRYRTSGFPTADQLASMPSAE